MKKVQPTGQSSDWKTKPLPRVKPVAPDVYLPNSGWQIDCTVAVGEKRYIPIRNQREQMLEKFRESLSNAAWMLCENISTIHTELRQRAGLTFLITNTFSLLTMPTYAKQIWTFFP
jgi:hypothetical protein